MANSEIDQPLRRIKGTTPLADQDRYSANVDFDERAQNKISGALNGMPGDG
jgi:hypothetical protein